MMLRQTIVVLLLIGPLAGAGVAQTPVDVHRNKYTPAQDVQLGRQAAAEVERQTPLLRDEQVGAYVAQIGRRLVEAIPPERRVPEFQYTFKVTNLADLNAFALPGGPMYVNRGMLAAARNEGEIAGVMAHELSHVVLRHGTAQATAATKFQVGQVAGQILGGIVGGRTGSVIAQGSQFGLGTYFLKYSREFERESDLLGAQIMARAGYDPRDMARMFQTLQAQGGARAPEWLSTHPDPGNRSETINREAASLGVQSPVESSAGFASMQARLRGLGPAQKTGTATRATAPTTGTRSVEPPSPQYRDVQGDVVRLRIPSNWQQDATEGHLTYTPPGAVYQGNGASGFTHGVQIGSLQTQSADLQQGTAELLQFLERSNPQLRIRDSRQTTMSGRPAQAARLTNTSDVTGQAEAVSVWTTRLRDGSLLYMLGVAPAAESATYDAVFERVRQSLQLADGAR